jgi:hypothetical protein
MFDPVKGGSPAGRQAPVRHLLRPDPPHPRPLRTQSARQQGNRLKPVAGRWP